MAIHPTEVVPAAWQTADQSVFRAVSRASRDTGVDFAYLMNKARAESSFQPNAKAKSSSATGLFQFLDGTWLDMVKRHGDKHGLGRYQSAIQHDSRGNLDIADKSMKQELLDLRYNPVVSAKMAAEFAADNKEYLEGHTNTKNIGSTDLYLAHFMGAKGASEFISAKLDNPYQYGADLFKQAANANRGVFYTGDGRKRTLSEIYDTFAAKFEDHGTMPKQFDFDSPTKEITPNTLLAAQEQKTEQGSSSDVKSGYSFIDQEWTAQFRPNNIANAPISQPSSTGNEQYQSGLYELIAYQSQLWQSALFDKDPKGSYWF